MGESVLVLDELRAGYDGVAAVDGLSLRVEPGEVVALLGPNGAGKTTTLLTISGLLPALGGTVEVLGEPLPKVRGAHKVARRGVAHVPESRGLIRSLTVRENLRLGCRRGEEASALDLMPELVPLLDRRAALLSGGEQQMLAIARAIASKPRLLMVDEMSLGLAPVISRRLAPVVRRAADELGTAVILVEQHADLALSIADSVVVLSHGRIKAEGTAERFRADRELVRSSYLGG